MAEFKLTPAPVSRMDRVVDRARSRKCLACGHRYARKLPNCPVCKTLPGHDGIDRTNWIWPPVA